MKLDRSIFFNVNIKIYIIRYYQTLFITVVLASILLDFKKKPLLLESCLNLWHIVTLLIIFLLTQTNFELHRVVDINTINFY